MANFLIPTINHVESLEDRKMYEAVLTQPAGPAQTLCVTVTARAEVFVEWVAKFNPEHQSFFPVGVAVHNQEVPAAQVLTLSIGQECLVFQLYWGTNSLSRDVTVFLRDVCTCYGWRVDAYNDLLKARHPKLYLGRLTDIQNLVTNGHDMGLGDFSVLVCGRPVHEPTISTWTERRSFKKSQIRETVMEAYISHLMGVENAHAAPPNNSLTRVISSTFPQINRAAEMADRTMYQVTIGANHRLRVTYTNRVSVLTTWLRSLGRSGMPRSGLIGIDVNTNHRAVVTVMGLASGMDCLLYNLEEGRDGLSPEVMALAEGTDRKLVGWNTQHWRTVLGRVNLPVRPERLLDIKDDFPITHSYDDLARLYLGYEMPKLAIVGTQPNEQEIMRVAVQAFVCLARGMDYGY